MENIYEQLLHSTIRIQVVNPITKQVVSTGTGFFVSRLVGNNLAKIYLVSNKHVLDPAQEILLTFTQMENGLPLYGEKIKLPISQIASIVRDHPDPKVDVAVIECTNLFNLLPNKLYCKAIPLEMFATFEEEELSVTQNITFIGYPQNRFDEKNNLPLVRTGMISSHPKLDFNGDPVFIIDAQVYPGSSGSPVIIDLSAERINDNSLVIQPMNIKLLGIVASTYLAHNEIKAIPTGMNYFSQEVMGLGIVFKAPVIKELIESLPTDN